LLPILRGDFCDYGRYLVGLQQATWLSIPQNQPSRRSPLQFVRCSDWFLFEEDRRRWRSPWYIYEPRYLETLPPEQAEEVRKLLASLKEQFACKRHSLLVEFVTAKHEEFLRRVDVPRKSQPRVAGTPWQRGIRRITHCYVCKEHLDNAVDLECTMCGWIICGNCGACGCGYGL